jgi:RNA polymerase sigma-19 factor, ECF subfamily
MDLKMLPFKQHNDQQLLSLVSLGNEAAFTTLFENHHHRIYSIALKFSKSPVLAEEVVQDVFLKIWQKREGLLQIQNFEAYLYTIVQHSVYRSLKMIARRHEKSTLSGMSQTGLEDMSSNPDPERCLIEKEYNSLLQKGIEELPMQQRQVYRLIREKGMKRGEVAELLQLQPDTVKFHLSKAVKSLWIYCKLHLHTFLGIAGIAISSVFKATGKY